MATPEKDSAKVEIPKTFDFGMSSTTSEDLDKYSRLGWFPRNIVRHSEGETVPKPNYNEVVVFRYFFLVGLRVHASKFLGTLME